VVPYLAIQLSLRQDTEPAIRQQQHNLCYFMLQSTTNRLLQMFFQT